MPHEADWVLTTPLEGVYLVVRLPDHETDRFGYGVKGDLMRSKWDLGEDD